MTGSWRARIWILLALQWVGGCEAEGRAGGLAVHDSAGVRLTTYAAPPTLPVWVVAEEPALSIGTMDGDPARVFSAIGGGNVLEASDGTLIVMDAIARELRAFSPSGAHLWNAGRSGSGPGEFGSIGIFLGMAADSVLAMNGSTGDVLVFDLSGVHRRTYRLDRQGAPSPTAVGVLDDGSLVIVAGEAQNTVEPHRERATLTRFGSDGTQLARIAAIPGDERHRSNPAVYAYVPLGRGVSLAAAGDRIAVTSQEQFAVLYYGGDGTLEMVLNVAREPRRPDRRRFVEFGLADVPDPGRRELTRQQRESTPLPDSLPEIDQLLFDSEGKLWIRDFVPPYDEADATWWIADEGGRLTATASVPRGFVPHRIGPDYIVGVYVDELGVQHVQRRAISK